MREREKTLDERSEFSVLGVGSHSSTRKAAFTLAGGRRPLLNSGYRRAAFTLAELLITLAVIGIVAVLTIPALVKNHQERAWSTARDLFTKKFEVAMKTMANNSTVSGYDSTESFVNELKKYIKITNVCTDDVTKCFAPKVVWNEAEDPVGITNNAVNYEEKDGYEWAETVGIQFASGVNALISYNKQCYVDPYNNQEAITAKCVGIIYDVSGFKTPNTNGKDILANANVASLAGKTGCVYTLSDGTCFTKILGPQGGYTPIMKTECEAVVSEGKLGIRECALDNDYWAGAVVACGGINKLPTDAQLIMLAQELYNDASITSERKDGLTLNLEKATPFLTPYTEFKHTWFYAWTNQERDPGNAYHWTFDTSSYYQYTIRLARDMLAICVYN